MKLVLILVALCALATLCAANTMRARRPPPAEVRGAPGRPASLEHAKAAYHASRRAKGLPVAPAAHAAHDAEPTEDGAMATVSAAYGGDASAGSAYTRLRRLVEQAAREWTDDARDAARHFGALLHPNVDYVHQGRGHWHGLERVVATLVGEQRDEHGMASGRLQSCETLEHGRLHAVRELTELRRGGEQQARRLDVYFLRTDPDGRLITQIERMPSVENPMVADGSTLAAREAPVE